MVEDDLVKEFENILKDDITKFVPNTMELAKDLCKDNELLEEMPFVGHAFKLLGVGSKIRDYHCLEKLHAFIVAINCDSCFKGKREKYREKFVENESFRKRELSYLLILIDRYVGVEKPQMLARIYLAYLDGNINWTELMKYAEIVDRFLPGDREFLLQEKRLYYTVSFPISDAFLRLAALGIYEEYMIDMKVPTTLGSITIPAKQEKTFKTTVLGEKLQDILQSVAVNTCAVQISD